MRALLFVAILSSCSFVIDLPELPFCGDGVVDPAEECDDGNLEDGDGCDRACRAPAERLFNTTIQGDQSNPRIAFFPAGGGFVVFDDDSGTPPEHDNRGAVRARYLNADGEPIGADFVVHHDTRGEQSHGDVAAGDIAVIVWDDASGPEPDFGVRARAFAQNGGALGGAIALNQRAMGDQRHPAIAVGKKGFLVAWVDETNLEIRARRIDLRGEPFGDEITIATDATAIGPPAIGAGRDRFLVVWPELNSTSTDFDIEGRLIDWDLSMSDILIINSTVVGAQTEPSVAFDPRGERFLVAWTDGSALEDMDATGIRGRFVSEDGTFAAPDFAINEDVKDVQETPTVTATAGVFLVAWNGRDAQDVGIVARFLASDGTFLGGDRVLNSITRFQQEDPAAVPGPGGFHVLWEDESTAPPDIDEDGIRGLVLPFP